jgi:hypothetical protein
MEKGKDNFTYFYSKCRILSLRIRIQFFSDLLNPDPKKNKTNRDEHFYFANLNLEYE